MTLHAHLAGQPGRAPQEGHSQAAPRNEAGAAESSGQADIEFELRTLSGDGIEEEVLVQELHALQAARQELQRASVSQVQKYIIASQLE